MSKTPFPVDPALTAITIGYRNAGYIADEILPRVTVAKQEFKYMHYPIEETFASPDTHVGRRGTPNEVDLTANETTSMTEDFGLDDPIPQPDIDDAPPGYDPVGKSVTQLTDYVALGRERRVASLVFAAASYPTGNKIQLSGEDQFSDFANSDPIAVIMAGLDACLVRPTVMAIGHTPWSSLAQHPDILKAIHGNSGDSGIARRRQVADLFELEDIYVGQSRLNTAKKGQSATLSRVWGNHISLMYRDRNADTRNGLTFGFTAQRGTRIAGAMPDSKIGLRGGQRVRVGESVKELVVAGQAGYFIEDAV